MLWSIAMYYVVMRLVAPTGAALNPALVTALIVAAFALVVLSFPLKSRLFSQSREAGKPGLRRTGYLLALILCDSAALMAIVAWFLTASPQSYYPLIIGAAGVLLHYPSRES